MRSKAFFFVILWQFLNPAIQYVATTAAPNVTQYWAGVGGLQKQVMNILGYAAFSWALYVVRERFLHVSWRRMLITTTVGLVLLDVPFTMLTVFDVVRNQYFYLSEALVQVSATPPTPMHFRCRTARPSPGAGAARSHLLRRELLRHRRARERQQRE